MEKRKFELNSVGMKGNLFFIYLLLFSLVGCLNPQDNYFNKALNQASGGNEIRYTPEVAQYKVEGGTIRLNGANMDQITSLQLGDYPLIITKQDSSKVIAMASDDVDLTLYDVVNLFVSSAYGQSVIPLEVDILDSAITEKELADGAVTSSKIQEEAVTLDKLSTADANDGDVVVYSRTQGQWIPGTIGGLTGTGNNVTSLTIGNGLKTDGGDETITSSGTVHLDFGHYAGQVIPLNENTKDTDGPGYLEHNGIIRAYAVDADSDGQIEQGETYGQFSLVNTYNSTSSPRFDYRLSFGGNKVTSMVIREEQKDRNFIEFDSNDALIYIHQDTETTKPLKMQLVKDDEDFDHYDTYFSGTSDSYGRANAASDFLTRNHYTEETTDYDVKPLLEISDGLKTEDLHVTGDTYNQGTLRNTGNARFESNMNIDGELEVEKITGALEVSGGLSVVDNFGDDPILDITTAGTLTLKDGEGDTIFSISNTGALNLRDGDGDLLFAVSTGGEISAKVVDIDELDYAEYFDAKEVAQPGDVIGIDLSSGLARKYRSGDFLIGVASTKPGVAGGVKDENKTQILVGLMGQVPVNEQQTKIKNGMVYTIDDKQLGVKLASGDIYINHTTSETSADRMQRLVLEKKVKRLEEMMSKLMKNK